MKYSAGLLIYKLIENEVEVFLVHPGGPFWAKKDKGAWSIPKGEFILEEEDSLQAAIRETEEETGFRIDGSFKELNSVQLKSRKIIFAWAVRADPDPEKVMSNTFEMEWPPRSGKTRSFPEIDRAEWFKINDAYTKISAGQKPLLNQLTQLNNEGNLL
jgi:predicted NUDIX family NTP pyrophosphohydrolase